MMPNPKISFILPCYNDGPFLAAAIASVEACAAHVSEMILIDDGSTNGETLAILDKLSDKVHRVIRLENSGGPAHARNAGIVASSGEYILPLDADNRIRSEFIEMAAKTLDSRPEIDIVHSDFQYYGLHDHIARIADFDVAAVLYANYIDTCALYRREVWADCGGYDEASEVRGFEDWDFWLEAYRHGKKFLHLDMVGFDYASRSDSQLNRIKKTEAWKAGERYIFVKYADLVKEHYRDLYSWDRHGRELRGRPLRTLTRLFLNAASKRLHDKMFNVQRP